LWYGSALGSSPVLKISCFGWLLYHLCGEDGLQRPEQFISFSGSSLWCPFGILIKVKKNVFFIVTYLKITTTIKFTV
jgi:hypothetical protein